MDTTAYRYQIPDYNGVRSLLPNGIAEGWRFLAVMPDLGDAGVTSNYNFSNGGVSYTSAGTLSTPQIPNALCESINIPTVQVDMDERYGQGTSISVPRKWSYPNANISFYESSRYEVSKYLWTWKQLIADGNQLYNVPKVFKKQIDIYIFNAFSNYSPICIVNLIDCCPTSFMGGLEYNQTAQGYLTVTTDLVIDDQEINFIPQQDINK